MKKLIVILLLTLIILSGCSYGTNVENQAFVVAVGIDKGEVYPLKLTFIFANPDGGGGGGSSEGKEESSSPKPDAVTVEAPTVFSAIRKLDSIKSKAINMTHIKIVVFSDTVAKEGIKKYLTGFASSRDFRPNTYVCVSLGDAEKYLKKVKPSHETFIEKYYDNIMHKVAEDKVNEAYLYYLYFNLMEEFSGSLVPLAGLNSNKNKDTQATISENEDDLSYEALAGEIIRDAENPAEILGCAVFKNDKMVGALGSFHTDMARIICNEYYPRNYSIYYPESNDFVTFRLIQQNSPSVKASIKNSEAFIHIKIPVSIEYVDAGKIESEKESSDRFCRYLQNVLDKKSEEVVNKAQNEYKSDVLGLGDSLKKHFTDIEAWRKWNWEKHYETASVSISFDVEYADFEEAN